MRVRTNLALLLKNRNMSLSRLSQSTGVHRHLLSYMANGRMVPSDAELEEICKVLNVTADMVYPDPDLRKALAE